MSKENSRITFSKYVLPPFGRVGVGFLQRVQHLFLYLFQLILHLHDDVLHFSLVAFTAGRVDFPTHFLGYEAKFLADTMAFFVHRFTEILQVIGESLLLFADV